MAVEDGAIIATLLGFYQRSRSPTLNHITLRETLRLYENLQKERTTMLTLGSISNQQLYHLEDGPEQEERDRILKSAQWQEKAGNESEPFIWVDVFHQKAVVGRDAIGDAAKKWQGTMKLAGPQ
jgi:salicylate hydroxylase